MKVTLQGRDGTPPVTLDLQHEDIMNASVLEYEDRFFIFQGFDGRFLSEVRFTECAPPMKVGGNG